MVKLKKPEERQTDSFDYSKVPEHSMGIDGNTGNILIKVDSGKYSDSIFEYIDTSNSVPKDGILEYNAAIRVFIKNGVEYNANHLVPDDHEDFKNLVTTPILLNMVKSIQLAESGYAEEMSDSEQSHIITL